MLPRCRRARWLHLVAAITWIRRCSSSRWSGAGERREEPAIRARLFHAVGVRFRTIGWIRAQRCRGEGLGNLWLHPYFLRLPRSTGSSGSSPRAGPWPSCTTSSSGHAPAGPAPLRRSASAPRDRADQVMVFLVIVLLGLG